MLSRGQPRLARRRRSATSCAPASATRYPLTVDNEGNLAALAEAIPGDPDRQDILVIFGEVGVGGGIVAAGRPLRGRQGYAGEFGHMIVEPQGRPLRLRPGRLLGDRHRAAGAPRARRRPRRHRARPGLALDDRSAELNRRAALGDTRTLAAMARSAAGSASAPRCSPTRSTRPRSCSAATSREIGHHMRPAIESRLAAGVLAPDAGGTRVELSTSASPQRSAAAPAVALDAVFDDPTLVAERVPPAGGAVR